MLWIRLHRGANSMNYDFFLVDAFTWQPLYGNPAAVVFDADDLASENMQKVVREMNLL